MTKRHKLILFVLDKAVETFKVVGDIIIVIWAIQLITNFEWHDSYWFDGYINAWMGAAICWMIGLLIHIFELHFQQKYKK